jgi:hypothetical protein
MNWPATRPHVSSVIEWIMSTKLNLGTVFARDP